MRRPATPSADLSARASFRRKPLPEGLFSTEIVDLAEDGRGIARVGGKVVFVPGGLPGEQLQFRYTRVHRDADEGEVVQVERASPDRVAPPCAHFGLCGGCSLQHLAPAAQLRLKERQLLETLRRIGRFEPEGLAPAIAGPTLGYRRRARLGVKWVEKRNAVLVGFRERSSPFLAALESCAVLDPRVGKKLRALGECLAGLSIRSQIPQIEVACAEPVALVLRVLREPGAEDRERLQRLAREEDFDLYLQPGGPGTIVPLSPPARRLDYSPDGSADRLQFQPTDFIQINEAVSQQAVRQALDWLQPQPQPQSPVLELFCGLGNFSIPLARRGARVTAVEGEPALVERARANAQRLGLDIRFHAADLFVPDAGAGWLRDPFEAVLLDPPRAGAEAMIPIIGARQPARIVYVSCHPGTLARDAGRLVHEFGYRCTRAGVMDMFAHTAHVEAMALFVRN